MDSGKLAEGPEDPVVTAAAWKLVEVLNRKGISAGEIKITFSQPCESTEQALVNIQLPSLTDSLDVQPDFNGLQGVFILVGDEGGSSRG